MWGTGMETNASPCPRRGPSPFLPPGAPRAESGRAGASCPVPRPIPPVPPPGTNICAQNNGDCQQLCLFRGGGQRTCACAHGMLSEDGVSCRDYDGYLLYSERTILKSIHLSDENNLNAPIKPFEDAEHMKNVIALAFDYRYGSKGSNRIFYSDIHFGNIQQINDDGTGRKTIVESEWHRVLPSVPALKPLSLSSPTSSRTPKGFGPWIMCFVGGAGGTGSTVRFLRSLWKRTRALGAACRARCGTESVSRGSGGHGSRNRHCSKVGIGSVLATHLPRQRPEPRPSGCPALASPPALALHLVGFIGTCSSFKEPWLLLQELPGPGPWTCC